MTVSFVGATTDHSTGGTLFNGTAAPVAPMPAGIAAGDVAIVSMDFFGSGTTVTLAGYASQLDNTGTASDHRIVYTITLAGSETSVAPTMSTSTWGTLEVLVLRGLSSSTPTNKISQATSFASGGGSFTNPSLTIGSSTDATVYGYPATASGNSSANQPTFTASPGSLSNWTSDTASGTSDGAAQGIGWGTNVSAPGTATINIPGPTTGSGLAWALDLPAIVITPYTGTNGTLGTAATPGLAQPGNFIPGQVEVTISAVTANAGLATGTGAAQQLTIPRTTGLATSTGSAFAPAYGITAGLATATGTALAPATGSRTIGLAMGTGVASGISIQVIAGLASGVGAANAPNFAITSGLATGAGTAGGISIVVNAGLATSTSTSFAPAVAITPVIATATGTAQGISQAVNAGLATGAGHAFSPGTGITSSLATGTGAAGGISQAANAGLATGTGTAFGITVASPGVSAGLATATGAAGGISQVVNAGLATGSGTSSGISQAVNAGLATGTGTVLAPSIPRTSSLATGIGTALTPAIPRIIGLATSTGAAFAPAIGITAGLATGTAMAFAPSIPRTTGLATGTGNALAPSAFRTAGLATGTGATIAPTLNLGTRHNVDYTGSTLSVSNTLGGTISVFTLGGTLSVTANTLGGAATVVDNQLGGTVSVFELGGSASVTSDTLAGTLSVAANTLGGTTVEDKMQEVDIILNEFNDSTVTFQILNNGSPDNITGSSVQALFKKVRGDLDTAPTTKTYSSTGGSPAITIVTPSTGSCTLEVPGTDVIFGNMAFYRIDVIDGSGFNTTAIFGTVTVTQL